MTRMASLSATSVLAMVRALCTDTELVRAASAHVAPPVSATNRRKRCLADCSQQPPIVSSACHYSWHAAWHPWWHRAGGGGGSTGQLHWHSRGGSGAIPAQLSHTCCCLWAGQLCSWAPCPTGPLATCRLPPRAHWLLGALATQLAHLCARVEGDAARMLLLRPARSFRDTL